MFLIQVAADIFGNKINFELSFSSRPSVPEIMRATETAFSNEIALRRPAGVPVHSFHASKIKVYDEDAGKWVDLRSETQLIDSCQCYAFQGENAWHKETQKEIPPAVRPPTTAAAPLPVTMGGYGGGAATSSSYLPPPQAYASANNSAAAYQATTSYNRQASGRTIPAGFTAVDASDEEKLRAVFAEFDVKSQRMIDPEDLVHGFRSLGFDLSAATIKDLFQKGDTNSDGRISFGEFETFAKWYPIMTDCLFYRSRAFWEDKNMEREIEKEKEAVRHSEGLVAQAEQQLRNAKQAEEDAQTQIIAAEQEIRDKGQRQRDLAAQADQAERDREKAARDKADKEADALAARDAERHARNSQTELAREFEKHDRKQQALALEATKCDEKVRQLQAQLAEAQRLAERAHQSARLAQSEAEQVRDKERSAAKNADTVAREIPRKDEALKHAETTLAAHDDRLRELEMMKREVIRDQEEAARRRDAADRASHHAAEHVTLMADEVAKAKRLADERARVAKQREDDLREQQLARQRVSAEEQALVDQEIKLREQRESLESKETKLHNEATSFLGKMRHSLSRGPSRDPSYSR
jgi:hypothetical protein